MALSDYDQSPLVSAPSPYLPAAFRRAAPGMFGSLQYPSGGGAAAPIQNFGAPISLSSIFSRGGQPSSANPLGTLATPAMAQPLVSSTKSSPLQTQIDSAAANNATATAAGQQSLTDFTKDFIANRGQVNQYGQQEQQAVSDVYDPNGLQKRLADINAQRQANVNQSAQSAIGQAIRNSNVARMQSGNSSYLDRALAQQLAGINTNAAIQGSDFARQNAQYVNDQRQGNIGRRQSIIDSIMSRNLMPAQAAQQVQGYDLYNLSALTNLNNSNNVYQSPEDAYTQRINFLNSLRAQGYAY